MDYTKTTLGELLSSNNQIIRRNAISILKVLQGGRAVREDEEITDQDIPLNIRRK